MKLAVGQVLYVVMRKATRILPVQVIEEMTKRTIADTVTTYMVQFAEGVTDPIDLSTVDGDPFATLAEARSTLLARITAKIDAMLESARELANLRFGAHGEASIVPPQPLSLPLGPSTMFVTHNDPAVGDRILLADGTEAKIRSVKLPDALT